MRPEDVPGELVDRATTAVGFAVLTRDQTRRLLAAVIPLIEAREREACAAMVDCGCLHKADVLAVRDENSGDRWRACGRDPCGALEARAIRTRVNA